MDILDLLTTPIDDLYDMGMLPEPEPERNVKQCRLTFACALCGDEYSDIWRRPCPDKVSRGLYCTKCNLPSMFLKQATPSTLAYRSRSMEIGSFGGDDPMQECWYCGVIQDLVEVALSNEQKVACCRTHMRLFAKEACAAKYRKADCVKRYTLKR